MFSGIEISSSMALALLGLLKYQRSIIPISLSLQPHDQPDAKSMALGPVSPKHKAQLACINVA